MLRIYRIYDDILPMHREAIRQVQAILRAQFAGLAEKEILQLPKKSAQSLKIPISFFAFCRRRIAS